MISTVLCTGTCKLCNGTVRAGRASISDNFLYEVSCNKCLGIFYQGDDPISTGNVWYNSIVIRQISPKSPTNTVQVTDKWVRTGTEEEILSRPCIYCGNKTKKRTRTRTNPIGITVYCQDCYKTLSKGKDHSEAIDNLDKITCGNPNTASSQQTLTMMVAYEENKKRNACIVCGKPLENKALAFGTVRYCACIENLPRE